ncbi:MAG: hypothetical protein MUC38_05205 [Cyclobacteriaceae bacterium]|jgi:hypothetical protein|nr:hypothetical protein [Cyclobacteriaceae bacterium]
MKSEFLFATVACILFFSHPDTWAQRESQQDTKFYNITEIGYGTGIGKLTFDRINAKVGYQGRFFRLRTQLGYRVSERLGMGLGFGLDGYQEPGANTAPAFIDVRYRLSAKPNAFFLSSNVGYSLHIGQEFERGTLLHLSLGKRVNLGRLRLAPSIGIQTQQIKRAGYFVIDNSTGLVSFETQDLWYKTISFNLGFLF